MSLDLSCHHVWLIKTARSTTTGIQTHHSYTHDHDTIKAFTVFMQVLGDFIVLLVVLTEPNRNQAALASIIIFAIITTTIVTVNIVDVLIHLYPSKKSPHDNVSWLMIISKILTAKGVVCYYIANNLPGILSGFSSELNCDAGCIESAQIASVYFLFVALTSFVFLPEIFRKANKILDDTYNVHHIRKDLYKEYHVQYLVIRMLALVLDFDTIYTGVWEFAFENSEDCDTDDILGSSACVLTGWVTWIIYTITYIYYLTSIRISIKSCTNEGKVRCCLNGLYFVTLALFFTTFFPLYLLADNVEPLSCGRDDIGNTSLTLSLFEARSGVLETRIAFVFYEMVILILLGVFGTVKYHQLEEIKDS